MEKQAVIIVFTEEFDEIAEELMLALYVQDYFGFIEDAKNYVDKIYAFIKRNIAIFPARNTPDKHKHYGEKYLLYKANANTTWYIFFSQIEQVYFVQFITNNHTNFVADFNL